MKIDVFPHCYKLNPTWKKRSLRQLLGILVIVLVYSLAAPGLTPAAKITAEMPILLAAAEEDIESYRVKIRRLERGITDKKLKDLESSEKEYDILNELEDIQRKFQLQQDKVDRLRAQVEEQQRFIDAKEKQITTLQAKKQRVLKHLQKRITAYYQMGKIGFLNVAFSSRSLPELIQFHESFQHLIDYDQQILATFRNNISDLKLAQTALALEKDVMQDFVDQSLVEKAEIDRIRNEKEQLLVHIRTQKKLYKRAIQEMESATKDLSETLLSIKSKSNSDQPHFTRSKGRMPPPVSGEVITRFNEKNTNKLGITKKSSGISILAPDGTKVKAIAPGTVIFSGYLRGYGNTVIIHHGFQYYSVTSRLEKIARENGDTVETGTYIGKMGDTAALFDEGLYFEIRHGKKTKDPLKWINASSLQLTSNSRSKKG